MGRPSRDKGHAAERELARLLTERLGVTLQRRLGAARDGGHDLDIPGFALEVKRAETLRLTEWWAQACDQAEACGGVPVLAFRQSRRPWRFMLPLHVLLGYGWDGDPLSHTATLDLDGFCEVVREKIGHGVAEN